MDSIITQEEKDNLTEETVKKIEKRIAELNEKSDRMEAETAKIREESARMKAETAKIREESAKMKAETAKLKMKTLILNFMSCYFLSFKKRIKERINMFV